MIQLHRLSHPDQPFVLNADLILRVERTPDTVISLTSGDKFIVRESMDDVVELVRNWRGGLIERALQGSDTERARLAPVVHLADSRPVPASE
jgi:flagellar protein FlbD